MKAICKKTNLTMLILQIFTVVYFLKSQTGVDAEMVEGCIRSQLSLTCNERRLINISSVVLGDSPCWRTGCCPKPDSCTKSPSASHANEVHGRCDGRQSCVVKVVTEIDCGFGGRSSNNDFERITYVCVEKAGLTTEQRIQSTTVATLSTDSTDSTKTSLLETDKTTEMKIDAEMHAHENMIVETAFVFSAELLATASVIIVLFLAAVVLIIVILKKKKSWPEKIIVREEEMYAYAREFATHANDDGLESNAQRWSPPLSTDQLHGAVRNAASTADSGDSYFGADYANSHQLISGNNSSYSCTSNLYGRPQDFKATGLTCCEGSLSDATDAREITCEEIPIGQSDEQEFHSYANVEANLEAEKEDDYKNIGEIENRQVLLPDAKTTEASSTEGRESKSEELYCTIRSPEANYFKASGDRILVNNTLYHH